ncbi:MAG TPA: sugar ABC transporter permease [Phycisphaerae bacterium]|nr:sugar ABC transporter permease [Phycisphaerae bacterium]
MRAASPLLKQHVSGWRRRYDRWGLLFVLPALVLFGVMIAYPIGRSLYLSLFNFSFLDPEHARFVGAGNYVKLWEEEANHKPFWNTLYFTVLFTPPYVILGLVIAMLLNGVRRGATFLRTVIFIPVVVSLAVSAVMWTLFYNADFGMAQSLLKGVCAAIRASACFVSTFVTLVLAGMILGWVVKLATGRGPSAKTRAGAAIVVSAVVTSVLWLSARDFSVGASAGLLEAYCVSARHLAYFAVPFLPAFLVALGLARLAARAVGRTAGGPVPMLVALLVGAAVTAGALVVAGEAIRGVAENLLPPLENLSANSLANLSAPPQGVLGNADWSMPAVVLVCIWNGVGINVILFLVGLQRIPDTLYEAAEVDGATGWGKFLHVTVPQLAPTTYLVVLLSMIGSFKVFGQPFIMTRGGPMDSTHTFVMRLYNIAFVYGKFELGYASALAFALAAFIFVMTLGARKLNRPVD